MVGIGERFDLNSTCCHAQGNHREGAEHLSQLLEGGGLKHGGNPSGRKDRRALAGVDQWIERWPVNQRVASLIPSQGMCLDCGPGPQLGVHERQPHIDVSLPLFLSKNK